MINKTTFDGEGYNFCFDYTCKCNSKTHKISGGNQKGDTPPDFSKHICDDCKTEIVIKKVIKQTFSPDMKQVEDERTI